MLRMLLGHHSLKLFLGQRDKTMENIHELSAEERMPPVIAQKRRVNYMSNFLIEAAKLIAESKHCTLREAADFMTATIHKEYLKVVEEKKAKAKFGPLPDEYDPRNDSSVMKEE
jgi:hypothetical protein